VRLLWLLALLGACVWLIGRSRKGREASPGAAKSPSAHLVQDPVCKTFIPQEGAITVRRDGKTHHFCSDHCADTFRREHP